MNLSSLLIRIRPVELAELLKGLLGISYREVRVGERTFWLDPASNFGHRLITETFYEPEVTAKILGLLGPGDTFVDLGANEGYFSLLASERVGEGGHVFAIEPQARLWPVIIRNLMLNGRSNYTLVPYAIGDAEGFIEILLNPSLNTGASTAVSSARRRFFKRQKVGILPLEKAFERFRVPEVAVMKVDIEGYELNALRSLGPRLSEGFVRHFLIEVHPGQLGQLGQSPEELRALLMKSGYILEGTGDVEHWRRGPQR